jgi:hypothetical protein
MPESDWKQELYAALKGELDERLRMHTELAREFLADALGVAVLPHIDAAYQRGLMAGRSQAGYPTRRKKKESDPCTASAEGRTPASSTDEP